jgi:hypothetical protein
LARREGKEEKGKKEKDAHVFVIRWIKLKNI